jgi:hypothetical protein
MYLDFGCFDGILLENLSFLKRHIQKLPLLIFVLWSLANDRYKRQI